MIRTSNFKNFVGELKITYKKTNQDANKIGSSADAVEEMKNVTYFFDNIDTFEMFYIICLDRENKVIHIDKISEGGDAGTVADPKKIFRHALVTMTQSIILVHNHPSGNINPSDADNILTKRIYEAGKLLGISVLDHIIITSGNSYYSYADSGNIINNK